MRTYFCIILCLLSGSSLHAQKSPSLLFKHLDYKNGLSDPTIQSLLSDRYGFLWIGTHNGLNRFDGTNCVTFPLEGNMITKLYRNPQGEMYVGTQKGLYHLLEPEGRFQYLNFDNFPNYYAYPFYVGERIWCNIAGGIAIRDSTYHFLTDKTNGKSYVGSTENGRIKWLITNASQAGLFVHYFGSNDEIIASKEYFRSSFRIHPTDVYVEKDSTVWVASDKGLIRLNPHTGEYDHFDLGIALNCIYPYRDHLFIGTNGDGIYLWNKTQKKVIAQYKHQFHNEGSLSGNQIMRIHIDEQDQLYVSVLGKGLDYTNLRQVQFTHLLDKEVALARGIDNDITAMIQRPNGEIWCGTRTDGILVLDSSGEKLVRHYLKKDPIRGIFTLGDGKILVTLDQQRNMIYHPSSGQFTPIPAPNLAENVTSVAIDPRDNSTLLCTPQGAARWDGHFRFLDQLNATVEWKNISHIVFLNEEEVLVQTYYTNLSVAKREGSDFVVTQEVARTPFNINASVKVGDLLYLATSSGLYRFKDGTLEQLMSAYSTDLLRVKDDIWINTHNGLQKYSLKTGEFFRFTEMDGLQGAIFNGGTFVFKSGGEVLTAGSNGLNRFDPSDIKSVHFPSKAYITKVNINDLPYTEWNPISLQALILNHNSNTVSFQITPLDFINPKFRRITYQLLGFDSSPISAYGVTDVRYAKLPPGDYVLRILVDGNATELKIAIVPPFWQRSWFLVLSILSVIGITALSTYWFGRWVKNNQLEKMRIMLSSQEDERKRIAVDLHDDLGGRLSSLKLYMQAAARGVDQKEILKDTTRLLDEAISELRNILFNLSPKTLDENGLEAAIVELGNNIERITGLKVETNIDTGQIRIGRPVQYAVYRISQELINNTLKHSNATEVYISLINREDGLVFLFEDNGKGFHMDEVKLGYGLTNIKTHAQAIYSDLTIDTSPGKGIAVTLIIPKDTIKFESHPL
jgi:signal transduction histidine kinase/ligand-binding sensor domain-containing protein